MAKTHEITVDGIGQFVFRQRTMRDQIRIEAEATRVLGGAVDDVELRAVANTYATLLVLLVEAPVGWDLDAIDPLDPSDAERMFAVHRGLRQAEVAFRSAGAR